MARTKQYSVRVLLLLMTLASSSVASYDRVFNSYAKKRLIVDCMGEDFMHGYVAKIQSAIGECSQMKHIADQDLSTTTVASAPAIPRRFESTAETLFAASVTNPMLDTVNGPFLSSKQKLPFNNNFNWADLFDPTKTVTFQNRRIIPVPFAVSPEFAERFNYFQNFRTKRNSNFMYYPEEQVRSLKNRVIHSISNFTCVLRKINHINKDDQLQYDEIYNEISSSKMNVNLKTDLLEGMKHCASHATCMPYDKIPSTLGLNLKRVMSFFHCFEKQRFMACMKRDFTSHRNHFSLQGLDGALHHLEEDDQMLAIAWSEITMDQQDYTTLVF